MLFDALLGWLFQFLVQLYSYWMVLLTPLRNSSSVALKDTDTNKDVKTTNHLLFGKKKSLELKQSVKYLSFPKTSTNRWASKHGPATFGVDRVLVHVLFRLGKLSSIFGL